MALIWSINRRSKKYQQDLIMLKKENREINTIQF